MRAWEKCGSGYDRCSAAVMSKTSWKRNYGFTSINSSKRDPFGSSA